MFLLFCNFRNGKSYKIRETLQNKSTQNKGPPTVVTFKKNNHISALSNRLCADLHDEDGRGGLLERVYSNPGSL